MTEQEAIDLAIKRNKHKSKHLSHKDWKAVHDSVKGWHVALLDNHQKELYHHKQKARDAVLAGDTVSLVESAGKILLARSALVIEEFEKKYPHSPLIGK